MSEPIRVLVFGTTGTGKTSMCNTITGQNCEVSDSAFGVTFNHHSYQEFTLPSGRTVIITDTAGLNESSKGKVKPKEALKGLVKLLQNSREGYNLLIQVFRIPRITEIEEANYRFFVETISSSKIPAILVATGCEDREPMSEWKDENQESFKILGLNYKDIICTCFASGDGRLASVYNELRGESFQLVLDAIDAYATSNPVKLYTTKESLFIVLKKTWNTLANFFELPSEWKITLDIELQAFLTRLGFTLDEAMKFIEDIYKKVKNNE